MSKDAEPLQVALPSTDVALRVMLKPVPTGMGLIVDEIVVLLLTSIVPVFVNPPGPVIVYETDDSVSPDASCSARPSAPVVPSRAALLASVSPLLQPVAVKPPTSAAREQEATIVLE